MAEYTFQVKVDYSPDADTLDAIRADSYRQRRGNNSPKPTTAHILRENARALTLQAINTSEHPALTLVPDTLNAEASDAIQRGDPDTHFDYECQAFVTDGRYVRCGHPEDTDCRCFGRLHEGEPEVTRNPSIGPMQYAR